MIDRYRQKLLSFFGCLECVKANGKESLLDDKGNVLRVSYIYLSDTMEIWFDQSSRSNREENRKAEINPCFIDPSLVVRRHNSRVRVDSSG